MATVLVVEDKNSLRAMLEEMLSAEGWSVSGVASAEAAVEKLGNGSKFFVVLADWCFFFLVIRSVAGSALSSDPTLSVIVMTAFGSIETAVDAMKRGADEFITKPVDPDLLRLLIARAIERRVGRRESLLFSESSSSLMPPIIGGSAALRALQAETERVAATDATVLLEGGEEDLQRVLGTW